MANYIKPSIKVKKIKLNSFLYSGRLRSPFSNFNEFFMNQPVFAIYPPNSGTAGLKDKKFLSRRSRAAG